MLCFLCAVVTRAIQLPVSTQNAVYLSILMLIKRCFWITTSCVSDNFNVDFYHCSVHSEIYIVHSPTNALFIKLGKV